MKIKKIPLADRSHRGGLLPGYRLRKEAAADEMQKAARLPNGFSAEDIRLESSTCTGEKTIGFFDRSENRLRFAELVESDSDIEAFYKRYGLNYSGGKIK